MISEALMIEELTLKINSMINYFPDLLEGTLKKHFSKNVLLHHTYFLNYQKVFSTKYFPIIIYSECINFW